MEQPQTIELPIIDDFHTHLRQGAITKLIAKQVSDGGVGLAYVMPNLQPPIKTTDEALEYKKLLQSYNPNVEFLMTLYLTPELTPEEIYKAAKAGIVGVKSYPRGVTTNSDSGVESYTIYYDVFRAMEEVNMVLNIHGEVPSNPDSNVCVMNAEIEFLKNLEELHRDFPNLKIVLEHATTKESIKLIKSINSPNVACSITVHHLQLIMDDWAGQCHNFCKPVAKYPTDREALRSVIRDGLPQFFLGSDSAPHPRIKKESAKAPAGVFTTPNILPYLANIFESFGCLDKLHDFCCVNGRKFYGLPLNLDTRKKVTLIKSPNTIPDEYPYEDENGVKQSVVPFLANQTINWKLQ